MCRSPAQNFEAAKPVAAVGNGLFFIATEKRSILRVLLKLLFARSFDG